MHTFIDDPVDVVVSFRENRVIPHRMRWQRKDYDIRHVNLVHASREGATRIFYFSVSDLTNYFKLRLDTETLQWRLMEVYAD